MIVATTIAMSLVGCADEHALRVDQARQLRRLCLAKIDDAPIPAAEMRDRRSLDSYRLDLPSGPPSATKAVSCP